MVHSDSSCPVKGRVILQYSKCDMELSHMLTLSCVSDSVQMLEFVFGASSWVGSGSEPAGESRVQIWA